MKAFFKKSIVSLLLVATIFASQPARAAAASLADLEAQVSQLQIMLNALVTKLKPATAQTVALTVSGSVITVENDQDLLAALAMVKGGETIKLKPGKYSAINISPSYYQLRVGSLQQPGTISALASLSSPVTITSADSSNRAVVESLYITGSPNWKIENLSFRPSSKITAVGLNSNNIVFTQNDISFGNGKNWTSSEWNSKAGNGIEMGGKNVEVSYNYLKYVNFGIGGGENSNIHHNKIEYFIGDGMRAWDNSVIEHNYVGNPLQVNDNHIDGFQSWSQANGNVGAGTVKNITLRNNTFLDNQSSAPFSSSMQAIGLFDGMYDNFVIENNFIVINHGHGIAVYGGTNSKIRNNVALDAAFDGPQVETWIAFFSHKNGTPSTNNVYENNYANAPMNTTNGNVKVAFADYGNYFVNHTAGNFTLKSGAVPFTVGANISTSRLAPEPFGTGSTNPAPTPTPTPTPAKPNVTLAVSPSSITAGGSATLTWSSTNATTCVGSGAWTGSKTTSGTQSTGVITASGDRKFTLTCTGAGGSDSASATLGVTAVTTPAPTPTPTPTNTSGFKVGDVVTVKSNVNVRTSGLISTATLLGVNPLGSKGTLISGPTYSDDTYGKITWFKVNFDSGFDGWVGADNYQMYVAPTPTPTPVPTPTTGTVTITGISSGAVVAGDVTVVATPVNFSNLSSIVFAIDGKTIRTERSAPYSLGGDKGANNFIPFDTTDLTDGAHTLKVTAKSTTVADVVVTIPFTVKNKTVTPTPVPAPATTQIITTDTVNVRSTAGGAIVGQQLKGSKGVAQADKITVNGLQWFYVDFASGVDGYVAVNFTAPQGQSNSDTIAALEIEIARLLKLLQTLKGL